MATKEEFLNHIAARLGRKRRSGVKPPKYNNNPWDHLYKDISQEGYIDLFMNNITTLGANVVRVKTRDELYKTLSGMVTKENVRSSVLWKDSRLDQVNLNQSLNTLGVETKEWDTTLSEKELIDYAEQADLGFTFADMGLAETGSVILFNKGEQGRSVSLLPKVYATFVRSKDIKPRITDALKRIGDKHKEEGLPSLINFITGPSRSADIEMSLSVGVHGPGIVYVIILDME